MNTLETKNAGFINNYIAGNLEANSTELNLHSSKINELLRDLENEIKNGGFQNSDKLILCIRTTVSDNLGVNSEGTYRKLGQNLTSLISLIVDENVGNIPSYSTFLLKKIIYHFLNIAKASKLSDIERIGIEMADKFKTVWAS